MCIFFSWINIDDTAMGFIVDEVAKEFENVIFIVWNFSSY